MYHGHVILDEVIQWCLDNPEKFLYKGGWLAIVGVGLIILEVASYPTHFLNSHQGLNTKITFLCYPIIIEMYLIIKRGRIK